MRRPPPIRCPISLRARINPRAIACISKDHTLTYQELDRLIEGTTPPNLFMGSTSIKTVILIMAALRKGIPFSPLNTYLPYQSLTSQKELLSNLPPHMACYLFTSGTTNNPKIAALTLSNLHFSARGSLSPLKLAPGDRYLLSLPLFHISGIMILMRTFLAGATLVMPDAPFDHITHMSMVPTQLYRKLNSLPSSLKTLLIGGAPMPDNLLKAAKNLPIVTSYGMTEMASQVTLGPHILPYRELTIDRSGEILVRGKTLFAGYLKEDVIARPSVYEGWFPTGDTGTYSKEKGLNVTGRIDRQFLIAGENVQPEAIEKHLLNIPGIKRARVEPRPDPEYGNVPIAYIDTEISLSPDEISERLSDHLTKLMHPKEYLSFQEALLGSVSTSLPSWKQQHE